MPIRFLSLLLLQFLGLGLGQALAQVYRPGDTVENFTLINRHTGQPMQLADLEGKILFLDFFAHWCSVCNLAAPQLEAGVYRHFRDRGGNAAGVPVVYVLCNLQADNSQRDIDGTARFLSRFGDDVVVLEDPSRALQRRFTSASGQPTFAVINGIANSPSHRQWELVYSLHGYTTPGNDQPVVQFQGAINSVLGPAPLTPVSITRPPSSQSVQAGATVTFSVEATGTPPLSYRWFLDDQVIPDALGASLTLPNVAPAQAGQYSVEIRNDAGPVRSEASILEVTVPTPLRITVAQADDDGLNLAWTGGSPVYQVQERTALDQPWRNVGEPTSALSATIPVSEMQGFYRIVSGTPP